MSTKHGINPVTVPPQRGGYKLTLSRLHVQRGGGGAWDKMLTAAMWIDETNVAAISVFDEDAVIDALGHLFPHGELNDCNLEH